MRALVTGGAGFIGSNIVSLLLKNNWEVTVLDNLSSGCMRNLEDNTKENKVRFVCGDICNPANVSDACSEVDVVFHLAACVGRQKSLDNPITDSATNLIGTVTVLEGMRKRGINRIIYSSSAAVFGELTTPRINENHPLNADSPYGVSKLAAEKMILAYSGIYGITAVCLRYFNIYGINQRFDMYGNVIPIFAKRLYAHEPMTIYGDGTQTRDFVNVRDVARANLLAATEARSTAVYNLGSGSGISIRELADKMRGITGLTSDIQYAPERPADVKHCIADVHKVKNDLGFSAAISLDDGLREYLHWFSINCIQ